jgi:hypothetical protein
MKRMAGSLGLALILTASLPAAAGLVVGRPSPTDDTPQSSPTTFIAREQWIAPDMAFPLGGDLEPAFKDAAGGRLMRMQPYGAKAGAEDDVLGACALPRIVRAIRWARTLAGVPPPARAKTLMPKLKEAFAREGVPPELVWIAEVESCLDPGAESASGARGLFQFMPTTAERFGLLAPGTDDRGVPEKSAHAAARYLALLHKRFGNWHLALAGYNAGEGLVSRLLKRHQATTFEEIAPYLPEQTQDYVPRVTATLALREKVWLSALPSPTIIPTWN